MRSLSFTLEQNATLGEVRSAAPLAPRATKPARVGGSLLLSCVPETRSTVESGAPSSYDAAALGVASAREASATASGAEENP